MPINSLTSVVLGRYVKQHVPAVEEIPAPLRQYLSDEFQNIENTLQGSADANLQVADVEPEKPKKGMMRYAVSPWDPLGNSTQGLVVYNGSSWEAVQGSGGGGGPTDAIQDTDFTSDGLMKRTGNGTYTSITDSSANWDTAYGWGDHSIAGYLTSFTEANDLSTTVTWANVPDANITESSVTQHQSALSITESQIGDLQGYLVDVVSDTSPQLGGNLDLNSKDITGTGDISVTGTVTADKLMVDHGSYVSSVMTSTTQTIPHIRFRAGFSGTSQYSHWTQLSFEDSGGNVRGKITSNSFATSYVTTSDYRLKEDIQEVPNATSRTLSLKPCNFRWTGSTQRMDGFLAHELAEQVPEAVTGEKDAVDSDGSPSYQGIDQAKVVPLLVKTIQELEARITALEKGLD